MTALRLLVHYLRLVHSRAGTSALLALASFVIAVRSIVQLWKLQLRVDNLSGELLLLQRDLCQSRPQAATNDELTYSPPPSTVPDARLPPDAHDPPAVAEDDVRALLREADRCYYAQQLQEAKDLLLRCPDRQDVEVCWRLARLCQDLADLRASEEGVKPRESARARELLLEGKAHAAAALAADPRHWAAHKWYGTLLGTSAGIGGTKAKIESALLVKQHFETALELNPADATSHYLLGLWYFEVAGLSWTMRKLASAVYATPPEGTFEDARRCFSRANALSPKATSKLMLAKCCLQLKEKQAAQQWLAEGASMPPSHNRGEERAREECQRILETL
ncbi:hypothetical protein AB1Y20_023016 [Prymnesium parvum]|uniref:Regulator of microtubule dynamics protein 1 n=1 Tax=Prymnesium parvum TaxID=97485 RepID=A0AB34JCN3_PRYPA